MAQHDAPTAPTLSARDRAEQALGHSQGAAAVDMLEASRAATTGLGWALLALADAITVSGVLVPVPMPRVSQPGTDPTGP